MLDDAFTPKRSLQHLSAADIRRLLQLIHPDRRAAHDQQPTDRVS
jgi:hypothetical protein